MDAIDHVVILNDFSSIQGGAGYLAASLAQGIAARGLRVTMITGDASDVALPGVEQASFGGVGLLERAPLSAAFSGIYNRNAARQLRAWMAQHDTPGTIYHLHNWSNILSPAIFDALVPVSRRCVIHAHDYSLACCNGTYLDYSRAEVCYRTPMSAACLTTSCDKRAVTHKAWRAARHGVLFSRLRTHLREATFVIIHPDMRAALQRAIAPRNLIAIRNPISAFGPPVLAPERHRAIAHIGQVQRLKGVYELAEAGRTLGVPIDFFGSGEDLEDMRARHPEHHFHGWTDRETLARHLEHTRAAVVASQSPEPFCLAAFEVVATGLPLIVSDAILAAPELVRAGAALSFSAGRTKALTQVLERIMTQDRLVADLAAGARTNGPALGHGLEGWLDRHIELYEELVRPKDLAFAIGAPLPQSSERPCKGVES